MELEVAEQDRWTVVSLGERMDAFTVEKVKKELSSLVDSGKRQLVLDFSEVNFLSFPLIKYISTTARELQGTGGELVIVSISEKLKRQIDIYASLDHISLFRSNADFRTHRLDC